MGIAGRSPPRDVLFRYVPQWGGGRAADSFRGCEDKPPRAEMTSFIIENGRGRFEGRGIYPLLRVGTFTTCGSVDYNPAAQNGERETPQNAATKFLVVQ